MATDARGHTVPASSDHPSRAAWVLTPLLSVRDPIPVASATAQATLVSTLSGLGVTASTSNPIYTFRADAPAGRELEYTVNGSAWKALVVGAYAIYATSTTCASDGTWSVTFPAGKFSVAPMIFAQGHGNVPVLIVNVLPGTETTTGCSGNSLFYNTGGVWGVSVGFPIQVLAIQMTPSAAAG